MDADEDMISQKAYDWLVCNDSKSAGKRKAKKLVNHDEKFIEIKGELLSNAADPKEERK